MPGINNNTAETDRKLQRLEDALHSVGRHVGLDPFAGHLPAFQTVQKPPAAAGISVVGQDGYFLITLTAPVAGVNLRSGAMKNERQMPAGDPHGRKDARIGRDLPLIRANEGRTLRRMLHEVESALSSTFDATAAVTSYGVSEKLQYTIQDPNVTRVWRVRSRFEGSDFSDWKYFTDPATCGVVGVWSGLLRNTSLSFVATAYTPTGANPLTQHLTSTTIDVASSVWTAGAQSVSYSSGSVNPGGYGTYYVYCIDTRKAGGVVTYIATANVQDVTGQDGVMYFGKITTAGGGGGAGSGGGAGPCCIADVMIKRPDGSESPIQSLRKDDAVLNTSGGIDYLTRDPEVSGNVPCFSFRFANGVFLQGCSARHLLQFDGGGFDYAFDLYEGDRLRTFLGASEITEKLFLGMLTVYKLHLHDKKTYWADGAGSHNVAASLK